MKFPYSMLLDFVETSLTAPEIGDLLTMAGFELEGIEEVEGEPVLDIKVMSNRGDGLSILGLAREILAKDQDANPSELYERAARYFDASGSASDSVEIETPDCTRFACRTFRDIQNGQAPEWIRERLRKTGQRSISLFVDLTNYVMLELGQPLHAYDLDTLAGSRIVVRTARAGEKLTTLDGREHELGADQMMICDAEKPVGAAGIMGGLDTEVSESTKNVLLESAHFASRSVRRTRKQLGLNTDASYRFERSVDPAGVVAAIVRFTELLGQEGSAITDLYPGKVSRQPVKIRIDRARTLLGMNIRDEEAQRYLERLGMEVAGHGDPFYVVPPTWRPDIGREEDLVEELGRVHGYEKNSRVASGGKDDVGNRPRSFAAGRSADCGDHSARICPDRSPHPLEQASFGYGRRTFESPRGGFSGVRLPPKQSPPGLSEAFQRNGGKNLHLFEIGKIFSTEGGTISETRSLATITSGELMPSFRKGESVPMADFFSLKGDLQDILGVVGKSLRLQAPFEIDPRFHPTRQADAIAEEALIGRVGQIHPDLAKELRIDSSTYLSELNLDVLLCTGQVPLKIKSVSRNPSVRRDIALLIDKDVTFEKIESELRLAAGEDLERHWVFDDFEGTGIPEGKHSLGIAMTLRKVGENFTDQEANQVRDRVVEALAALGGTPR